MTSAPGLRLTGRLDFGGWRLDLDLAVEPGRWTCLVGPSGIGKSTLLRLLAGLEPGVAFEGTAGDDAGRSLEGRTAWMGQTDLLLPWASLRDNVTLGARLRGERPDLARAERLIAAVGLAEHGAKTPPELSGGMRQRAALARLLMEDRPAALLDEPFGALDIATRIRMQDLAFRSLQGRTVLLVTHDPHEAARLGHRILILTRQGLEETAPPPGAPLRDPAGAEVLETQARLTRRLLEAEAPGQGPLGQGASVQEAPGPEAQGQGVSGQGVSGQRASGQGTTGQSASARTRSGQKAPGQASLGQAASGENASGWNTSGQTASGNTAPGQGAPALDAPSAPSISAPSSPDAPAEPPSTAPSDAPVSPRSSS